MLKTKQPSPRELYNQRKLKEERERTAFLPPGLINHGNTCFMNSVLQGIIATKLLHDMATFAPISAELKSNPSINPARSPQLTNGHGVAGQHEQPYIDSMPIGDRLLTVLSRAWEAQSERRRESISPKPLLNALGRQYQQYLDFAQQDAHEFMRILFDAVRMEEIDVIKKRQPQLENKKPRKKKHIYNPKRRRFSAPTSPSDPLLPFTDMLFGGQLTSILVCQKCKHISQTYEDFYDISLSIKPEDYGSSSTSPPPSSSTTTLFSLGKSLSSVREKGKGETKAKEKEKSKEGEHDGHGRERKRDRLKKFAKRITTFHDTSSVNQTKSDTPRASSVPPVDSAEKQLGRGKSRKDPLRKRRSRSLDHMNGAMRLETVRDSSGEREGIEDEQGSGETNTTAPSTAETVESDWSVIKEEAEPCEEPPRTGDEKKKKKKDKEEDGWTKLGKRLNILARQPKDKETNSKDSEARTRRKSREPSPDHGSVVASSGRSTPRRDHEITPQPASACPNVSPPAIHHLPSSLAQIARCQSTLQPSSSPPIPKASSPSPLSQPPYQSPLLKVVPSVLKSTPSVGPAISHALHLNREKDAASGSIRVSLKYKHKPQIIRSPTSVETEYLRRILADIDLSGSGSSPTSPGRWPPSANASSSNGLVNPFALLIKSSGAKKGSDASESSGKVDATAPGGGSTGETRLSQKLSSWLGMNGLSGIEECLRLFTSVEVLDNENMVGCRRCWKMANREERSASQEEGDEHEDDMDDEESSSEEEDETSFQRSPTSLLSATMRPEDFERSLALNTPGGMPIPTISTTGPESPLEPPSRSRIPYPVRSNSADFVSLSALSSRGHTPLLDASTLHRNVSSPSIPSSILLPHPSPHSRSSYPPYTFSNQLYSRPPSQVNGRESLVIPGVPMTRRRAVGIDSTDESDESTSAMDSRSGAEDGDDGLSIGSSSSLSPPRSGESSEPRSLSDSGYGKEEPPGPDIVVNGVHTNNESGETENRERNEETKRPKKPKPVIMCPAYKRYLIATAPPVLVIHLKRFQQVDKMPLISFTPTYGFKKLDDYVTFPEYLDLTPFLAPRKEESEPEEGVAKGGDVKGEFSEEHGKCMYRLYAVVVHMGNMLGGHYVAYTAIPDQPVTPGSSGTSTLPTAVEDGGKPSTASSVSSATLIAPSISPSKSSKGSRQWAYISDANVRLATLEEVLKAKAYICMYERICS